jgi:hypothetical protein
MIDSTAWSSISSATRVWSPTQPTIGNIRGQSCGEAGREVVEHDAPLAGIDQRVHCMASDITGAAGDQHRHGSCRLWQKPYRARV